MKRKVATVCIEGSGATHLFYTHTHKNWHFYSIIFRRNDLRVHAGQEFFMDFVENLQVD